MKSKTGRNDPCPCGSGKKFKKCCERKMIDKRYLVQKVDQSAIPDINKTQGLSSLFQNSIVSSTRPEQPRLEIKATKGKLLKEKVPSANPEFSEEDASSPCEKALPTEDPGEQDILEEGKQPGEKGLASEIEPPN